MQKCCCFTARAEDSLGGWSEVKVKRRKTKWRHSLAQFDSGFKLAKVESKAAYQALIVNKKLM